VPVANLSSRDYRDALTSVFIRLQSGAERARPESRLKANARSPNVNSPTHFFLTGFLTARGETPDNSTSISASGYADAKSRM
jgi:hypothetical protein